ncbi:MAG: 2-oxo acid dehydrogenase subunit E2 [Christensenellaceae bacterium]|nr:2-oxo acid dehydrogenase subunit E2 [Christensenellaceae bacterium]
MRKDGKRLKNTDPMYTVVPHIMTRRSDSLNAITVRVPYKPLNDYINKKRKEGVAYSYLSLITAAYVRSMSEFPFLNRFIVNKRIYARHHVDIGMVVLRDGIDETMSKVRFELTDTANEVNTKMNEFILKNRHVESNSTDALIRKLTSSHFILTLGVNILRFMDRHGLLPESIINASPFHASMVISNLASIRTNHIHHHIYDFGTVGVLITIGKLQDIPKNTDDGIVLERMIPLGIVMDERIGSGLQFAKAFRQMEKYLKNPELLESPPKEVRKD